MLTVSCDRCGFKREYNSGIVTILDFAKGFNTLMHEYKEEGLTDLCDDCCKIFQKIHLDAKKQNEDLLKNCTRDLLVEAGFYKKVEYIPKLTLLQRIKSFWGKS